MFSVTETPFDQLPPALQALFSVDSKVFASFAATDSSEPANVEHKPDMGEQTAPALRCADVIEGLDAIEVHELELIAIDPESFALTGGEW